MKGKLVACHRTLKYMTGLFVMLVKKELLVFDISVGMWIDCVCVFESHVTFDFMFSETVLITIFVKIVNKFLHLFTTKTTFSLRSNALPNMLESAERESVNHS